MGARLATALTPWSAIGQLSRPDVEILLAGMPKSGTTAVAHLLAHCAGLSLSSDPFFQLDQRGIDFRRRLFAGEMSLAQVWKRHRWAFRSELVKDPNFPLFLADLLQLCPNSKVIFLVREPRQNIRSILDRLKLSGRPEHLESSATLPPVWRAVLEGCWPSTPGETYIEHLAWRWRLSADAYLRHQERCVLVRYEDFNSDKEGSIQRLVEQCGLQQRADIRHLLDRQYQPKGTSAAKLDEFFSPNNLRRIQRITEPLAHVFQY